MSTKYPNWYELPREETSIRHVEQWDPEYGEWRITGKTYKAPSWRDSQRQKIYQAETLAELSYLQNEEGSEIIKFTSADEIREYVFKVIQSRWMVRRFGTVDLPDVQTKKTSTAYSSKVNGCINFPPTWSWDQLTVLHEISHWVHPYDYGTSHGRFFARTFLELTGHEIGPVFRRVLKKAYREWNVKFTPFPAYSKETLEKKQQLGRQLAERYTHA